MTSYLPMARLVAATITALSLISVPLVASASMITPRPLLSANYGDEQLDASVISGHYQQVYPSTSFYVTEPIDIHQIRLRPRTEIGFSLSLSDVEISLGITSTRPLAISDRFEDNEGSTPTVVYSGPLELSSNGASGRPWRDFDIVVKLEEPFHYDPAEGNLLLDWNNRGDVESSGATASFDAISRRFASVLDPTGQAETGEAMAGGLATRFSDGVVPEPTGALLFAIGAVVTLARRRHA